MTIGDNRFAELGLNPDDVFVLHPSNRKFLTGSSPTPIFRPTRVDVYGVLLIAFLLEFLPFVFMLLNAVEFSIIGIVLIVISPLCIPALFSGYRQWRLRGRCTAAWQNASLVIGQVVSYNRPKGSSSTCELTYQYVSPFTNQSVKNTELGGMERDLAAQVGTPVIVVVYQKPVSVPAFNSLRRTMSPGFVL